MTKADPAPKFAHSKKIGVSSVETNKILYATPWQPHFPKTTPDSRIGTRIDNRPERWKKNSMPTDYSIRSIDAANVNIYFTGQSMLFSQSDLIGVIKQLHIEVPQIEDVVTYLRQYPELSELVSQTLKASRQVFGKLVQLSLEIYRDIETKEEYLTLYVRQNRYDPDIMKQIKKIRRDSRSLIKTAKGRFLLTTDFRPPR